MSVQDENSKSPKKAKPNQQPEASPKLTENGHSKKSKKAEKDKAPPKPAQTVKPKKEEKKKAEKRPAQSPPKSKAEKKKEKKSKELVVENGSADKDVEEEIEKMTTTEVNDELVPNVVVAEKSKKKKNKKEKIPTLVKIPTPITDEVDGSIVDGKTCFEWMINPMKADSFFTDTFEKRPVHIKRGNPAYYKHLLSTKVFDNMLRDQTVIFGKNLDVTSFTDGKRETHNPVGRAYSPGTHIYSIQFQF